jgi:hypothetical protein
MSILSLSTLTALNNAIKTKDFAAFKENMLLAILSERQCIMFIREAVGCRNFDVVKYFIENLEIDPSFEEDELLYIACTMNFTLLIDYLLDEKTVTVRSNALIASVRTDNIKLFEKLLTKIQSPLDILKFALELSKYSKADLERLEKYYESEKESQQKKIKI